MRTPEQKAKHATYMREYNKKPENKLKKKICDANYHSKHREETNKKQKLRYLNRDEEQKEKDRLKQLQYQRSHREEQKKYKKTFYSKETPLERILRIKQDVKRNKKSRQSNPQPIRDYNNKQHNRKRLLVFQHYSIGEIKCVYCGIKDLDMLSVDHIHNDGCKHRKIVKNLISWLITNNFPEGFQVLCMNCQFRKRFKTQYEGKDNYNTKYTLKQKSRVIFHYSLGTMKCYECEETDLQVLSADHIDGNGNNHRRVIKVQSGLKFYRWLIRNNFPSGFQILCMNHQFKKAKQNKEICGRPRIF